MAMETNICHMIFFGDFDWLFWGAKLFGGYLELVSGFVVASLSAIGKMAAETSPLKVRIIV